MDVASKIVGAFKNRKLAIGNRKSYILQQGVTGETTRGDYGHGDG